jgi:hypothetical protein
MRKTSNKCRNVGRLLYLYRDGELSQEEKSLIDDHARICSECASLLKKLHAYDNYLEPYRSAQVSFVDKEAVINATVRQSTKYKVQITFTDKFHFPDRFTAWLRPALIGCIALILCFLCFQQLRDALRSSALEHRLREQTASYTVKKITDEKETDLLLRRWRGESVTNRLISIPQSRAETGKDLYDKVSSLWRQLFGKKNGFIDHLREHYPGMASITVDDGLSKQERIILSTEGKSLIKELEQLTKDGEKQP